MEIEKNNDINVSNVLANDIEQESFINTTIGKTINTGIDIGLRALLPDFIENKIIDLKNNLLEYGLKDGISKTISETIQEGKNAIGIITGNFEDISQIQSAIKKGGTIDQISYALDFAIIDLSLYLDVYPNDKEVYNKFVKYSNLFNEKVNQYEKQYICSYRNIF